MKFIKLINNERKNKAILSRKAEFCLFNDCFNYYDRAHCYAPAVDICYKGDFAACADDSQDICYARDTFGCTAAEGNDITYN